MSIATIIQAFVFGIAFGCGACLVAFLTSIGNRRRHAENHDQLKLRNKLLEDSNSILRIIASCHVDAKRRLNELDYKAEKEAKAKASGKEGA